MGKCQAGPARCSAASVCSASACVSERAAATPVFDPSKDLGSGAGGDPLLVSCQCLYLAAAWYELHAAA